MNASTPSVVPPPLPNQPRPPRFSLAKFGTGVAWAVAVVLAGGLVYGYTASLPSAIDSARESACRPLEPKVPTLPQGGTVAPELELTDRSGKPVKLSDYRGRFVVLNFWASWCEPCLREWPELDKLAQRLAERDDVVVLAVSVEKDRDEMNAFVERMALSQSNVEVLHDPSEKAHQIFGSDKLPDTYFIDAQGNVRSVFVNARLWGRPQAQFCVEQQASLRF